MKKILLILSIALLVASCEPLGESFPRIWNVSNDTEEILILRCPCYRLSRLTIEPEIFDNCDLEYKEFTIEPRGYIEICQGGVPSKVMPAWFNYYFDMSVKAFGENVSWQILSEEGEVLRTWKYSDMELPGQRIFDSDEWNYGLTGVWHSAFFHISTEDIASE